nr:hypothetical protein [Tanacetum cinerariifolium]
NLENSLNSNQEKEEPPQDSDIRQLIREECCIEVCEEQKQNMENTILELVEICRQKELLCMHDNVDDLIEKSLQNFRVIHKSSISLNKTSQISLVHAIAPILSTKEPEYSPSIGYEHPNTTPETESDGIIKSGVEELVPILSENEVTSEDKRDDDDDFEDIEYVEASLSNPEIVSVKEENIVHQEEEEVDLEDISQIQDVILREKLLSINQETRSDITTHADDSLPKYDSFCFEIKPDQERLINVLKNKISIDSSSDPLLEEADLFLASDNLIPPGIENFAYNSERDIRFLEALFIDDSIPFPVNESSASDFDNPSFSRPPLEPPDAKFDSEEEISLVMNTIVEFKCLDPRDEFDVSNDENDDYFPFMFVIRIFLPYLICSKRFLSFLSAESEDTIFYPGISD